MLRGERQRRPARRVQFLVSAKTMPCPNKLGPILTNVVTGCHPLALKVTRGPIPFGNRARKKIRIPDNFLRGKTDNIDVDDEGRSNHAGRRRKSADEKSYHTVRDVMEQQPTGESSRACSRSPCLIVRLSNPESRELARRP